jgi:hypothetical protein
MLAYYAIAVGPKIRDLAVNAPFTAMVATLTNRALDE